MSILVDKTTRLLVQGITGREGSFHALRCKEYGANLVAGVLILLLSIFGVGGRIMTWLPMPIVMGMFAGSIFGYVTRLVSVTVEDVLVAGPTVAGYMLGRLIGNPKPHQSGWPLFSEELPSWLEAKLRRMPCPGAYRSWLSRR